MHSSNKFVPAMYKTLHFCQQGMFGNFVYLVSKNSVTGLTDLQTHFHQ